MAERVSRFMALGAAAGHGTCHAQLRTSAIAKKSKGNSNMEKSIAPAPRLSSGARLSLLNSNLEQFANACRPRIQEEMCGKVRDRYRAALSGIVSRYIDTVFREQLGLIDESAKPYVVDVIEYGSTRTGMSIIGKDLDLCVVLAVQKSLFELWVNSTRRGLNDRASRWAAVKRTYPVERAVIVNIGNRLEYVLKEARSMRSTDKFKHLHSAALQIKHITTIRDARVPLVNLLDANSGIGVDISCVPIIVPERYVGPSIFHQPSDGKTVKNWLSNRKLIQIRQVELVRRLNDTYPPLRPLVLALKNFMKLHGCYGAKNSFIGGHGLTLWVASFIKLHWKLCPWSAIYASVGAVDRGGIRGTNISEWLNPETQTNPIPYGNPRFLSDQRYGNMKRVAPDIRIHDTFMLSDEESYRYATVGLLSNDRRIIQDNAFQSDGGQMRHQGGERIVPQSKEEQIRNSQLKHFISENLCGILLLDFLRLFGFQGNFDSAKWGLSPAQTMNPGESTKKGSRILLMKHSLDSYELETPDNGTQDNDDSDIIEAVDGPPRLFQRKSHIHPVGQDVLVVFDPLSGSIVTSSGTMFRTKVVPLLGWGYRRLTDSLTNPRISVSDSNFQSVLGCLGVSKKRQWTKFVLN
ncbi:hypothetical protein BJ742DRAFT_795821 [Cladochytrium replicatum]|nr:hypothetical protein BJ742DRAFT_795821 [Cladochytrium replicatum]